LLSGLSLSAQISISGTVTDNANKESLPGASVFEKGTTNGTITDLDGTFELKVADNNAVVVVSHVGFITQEISVAGKTNFTIALEPETKNVDEVVIIGYGTV